MKKLLIATTNPGKLHDLKNFLREVPIELISLDDISNEEKVEETGKTFSENAILKATFYCKISKLPTLADDGGFEIDALGGEPGINSHRWIDPERESGDEDLIAYTIEKMKDIPEGKRGAQLRLVIALVFPTGKMYAVEEAIRGVIPLIPGSHRTKGYPYRSLLFLPEINKFYDHGVMNKDEIRTFDHRRRAVEKLKPIIRKHLLML